MAEPRAGKSTLEPNVFPAEFAQLGQKQFETLMETQKNFLSTVDEMNRVWMERAQSEANLVTEFMGKLTAARSIPEAAAAWQECMIRQLEMLAEDGRRLVANGDKAAKAATRLYSGGGGFGT